MAVRGTDCQVKRKRSVLSIVEKLKIIDKLESRVPVASIVDEYGTGLTTVRDLKRDKDKIRKFSVKFQVGSEKVKSARKTLKIPASLELEEAVYKWCEQQSKGVNIAWGGNSIGSRAFGEGTENGKF
jgi:IS30 family transposase